MSKKPLLIGFCILSVIGGALAGMVGDGFFSSYGGVVLDKEIIAGSRSPDHASITFGSEKGSIKRTVPHAVYQAVRPGDIVQKSRYGWAITISGARYRYVGMTLALIIMALLVCAGTIFSFVRYGSGSQR